MEKETPYEKLKRETDELETDKLNRIDKAMYEASGGTPTEEVNACSGNQYHNSNCDGFCDSLDSTPTVEEWEKSTRGSIERVLWKHYDPDASMNAEEIMDEVMPIIRSLLSSHDAELRRKIEGMRLKRNYDGDSLESACDAYGMSAESWAEIIRFEDGHNLALDAVLALLGNKNV